MRVAFVGAGEVTIRTAEFLIDKGHEVIIIEADTDKIDRLSEQLDCSFLNGDGSNPSILREVDPEDTDVLVAISNSDQANLIASLVGRSLGFQRVITSIQDPEFENICRELGLEDTIIPSQTISRFLSDLILGLDPMELSTAIKDTARFFIFTAEEEDAGKIEELELPGEARAICYYRQGKFSLVKSDTKIREGDEVVILTDNQNLSALKERWERGPQNDSE